jgi:hypothetical protein
LHTEHFLIRAGRFTLSASFFLFFLFPHLASLHTEHFLSLCPTSAAALHAQEKGTLLKVIVVPEEVLFIGLATTNIHGVNTVFSVFFARKSPNIQSYTVYINGSGQRKLTKQCAGKVVSSASKLWLLQ